MRGRTIPRPTARNTTSARPTRLGATPSPQLALRETGAPPLVFALTQGPYQNNGATPWYCNLPLGSPGQTMKIALDSGSNFIWVTSSLCGTDGCKHYGNDQFAWQDSSTYRWVDTTPQTVSFGPWGSMVVETGADYIGLPNGMPQSTAFYASSSYSGDQFAELDWDGGIGFPSGSQYAQPGVSFFLADLMDSGQIDPNLPYVQFSTDPTSGSGSVIVGGYDLSQVEPNEWILLPFAPYTVVQGVEYIWTTPLGRMTVGDTPVAVNASFALDSGSSCFKGDPAVMQQILGLVGGPNPPAVTLQLGQGADGGQGTLVVPSSIYEVTIQAGQQQGQTLPQFSPLDGVPGLILVGSVVMDQLVTILQYSAALVNGRYQLAPSGMVIFNKKGGPKIIQTVNAAPPELGRRAFSRH